MDPENNIFFDVKKVEAMLFKKYPFGYVPRAEIGKATGGLLHPKTMANRDSSKDQGSVEGVVKIGGKVCYPIKKVIKFLESETHIFEDVG
ncbi:MAG: hypothetical protein GY710_26850 [Desulfobacteraceae bacterium]|nr:hypothetical protein [Desulfobacteraceae bacterium]